MTDETLLYELATALTCQLGVNIQINHAERIHGGDINETYRIDTGEGPFFLKLNDAGRYPDMFAREFSGLEALRNARALRVPRPLAAGVVKDRAYLVTELVRKGKATPDFWESFAGGLAALHRQSHTHFGFHETNYIGSLKQYNTPYSSWAVFYAFNRLQPLTRAAFDRHLMDRELVKRMERLWKQLPQLFPEEPPALLHGDLWSGNFMIGPDGKACIYDPAVYYGHREMDLAMTRLFGGFDTRFYYAYQAVHPLAANWQQRVSLCQLYPLLVHLLLFGGSYYGSVKEIVDSF